MLSYSYNSAGEIGIKLKNLHGPFEIIKMLPDGISSCMLQPQRCVEKVQEKIQEVM